MEDYNNFKLYEKVIIVENNSGQGYVVESGNTKMLESAINWATGYNNRVCNQYEYDNGNFKIELKDAANGSWSQGGKLSFWNCKVTAPDGKVFLVGINSELLLGLLKQTTFVNGRCNEDLYFARRNNQVGLISKNTEEYKQAIKDQELRDKLKTAKNEYRVGDVIGTLTSNGRVYLGKIYKYFEIEQEYSRHVRVRIYKKPQHCFLLTSSIDGDNNHTKYEDWVYFETLKTKPKGIIIDHYKNTEPVKFIEKHNKIISDKADKSEFKSRKNVWVELNQFGFSETAPFSIEEIKSELDKKFSYISTVVYEMI